MNHRIQEIPSIGRSSSRVRSRIKQVLERTLENVDEFIPSNLALVTLEMRSQPSCNPSNCTFASVT